jgi:glycosyltransferase involved in cell wall biosynthesis
MRISVVTPSLKMAPYLEDTIASVIGNLRPGDEYFVIDGGSTDGSADVIRRHEQSLSGWVSEEDAGYADALAKGFDRATGDILCRINAGDLYLSGALDAARQLLTGDLDMIFGDDFYIDANNRVVSFSREWVSNLGRAMLYATWTPLQDACFWRSALYHRVGGIDRSLRYAADYDLFLKIALAGRAKYVPYAFSAFRRHAGQKSIPGAIPYRQEKMACRRRELVRYAAGPTLSLLNRFVERAAMSARARLAPFIWRRDDLQDSPVRELSAGRYWPRGTLK